MLGTDMGYYVLNSTIRFFQSYGFLLFWSHSQFFSSMFFFIRSFGFFVILIHRLQDYS